MEMRHSPSILAFELWSPTRASAHKILASWASQPGGLARGREFLYRDYGFLAAYWAPLAILAVAVGRWLRRVATGGAQPDGPTSVLWRSSHAATAIAWLPIVAAGLDAVENALLLGQVAAYSTNSSAVLPVLTTVVSYWKWALLLGTALFIGFGALLAGIRSIRNALDG
jgi:hypothetical protein